MMARVARVRVDARNVDTFEGCGDQMLAARTEAEHHHEPAVAAPVVAGKRGHQGQAEHVAVEDARLPGVADRDDDVIQAERSRRTHGREG